MKFVVSSTDLLQHLQAISRVISTKNTLPILDNFLFSLSGQELRLTASDVETTMSTRMFIENVESEGEIAIEAKRLLDILKEFPAQPLSFEINPETLAVDIITENGKYSVVGQYGEDYPRSAALEGEVNEFVVPAQVLVRGISKTAFAAGDDELRPVMNGIYIQSKTDSITFVASDSHKLVRYRKNDVKADQDSAFILAKKPAGLLKNLLAKEDEDVKVAFDTRNIIFEVAGNKVICRRIEGVYPAYESVIPKSNPNKMVVDRHDLFNTLRRVSVFSNQASNLIKLQINDNQTTVSAQDIDFSISAYERLNCQYDGEKIEIGFKSLFLIELLGNINSSNVSIEMSDPSKASLVIPQDMELKEEDILMLIMPMMIN